MKKLRRCIVALLTFIIISIVHSGIPIKAGQFDNAKEFYDANGNSVVYSGGYFYFGAAGAASSSGTRYRTLGWQISVWNGGGYSTMRARLGDNGLGKIAENSSGGTTYSLFRISYKDICDRLGWGTGGIGGREYNTQFKFDAIMTVVESGNLQGNINGDGSWAWGFVAYDKATIKGARSWGDPGSFDSYYDKGYTLYGWQKPIPTTWGEALDPVYRNGDDFWYKSSDLIRADVVPRDDNANLMHAYVMIRDDTIGSFVSRSYGKLDGTWGQDYNYGNFTDTNMWIHPDNWPSSHLRRWAYQFKVPSWVGEHDYSLYTTVLNDQWVWAYNAGDQPWDTGHNIRIDNTAPTIGGAYITNQTQTGFDVVVQTPWDARSGLGYVDVISFYDGDWQNQAQRKTANNGNGNNVTIHFNYSDFADKYGRFTADVRAYDNVGNGGAVLASLGFYRNPPAPLNSRLTMYEYDYKEPSNEVYWVKPNSVFGVYTDGYYPTSYGVYPDRTYVLFSKDGNGTYGTAARQLADINGKYTWGSEFNTYFNFLPNYRGESDNGVATRFQWSVNNYISHRHHLSAKTDGTAFKMYYATTSIINGTEYGSYSDSGAWLKVDGKPPTKTSVEIKNITNQGYEVYVYGVQDTGGSGVQVVKFPTWTEKNGQDDIIWADGTNLGNGTWYYRVKTSDHNYELGQYHTHIYMYDNVGNYTCTYTNDNIRVPYWTNPSTEYGDILKSLNGVPQEPVYTSANGNKWVKPNEEFYVSTYGHSNSNDQQIDELHMIMYNMSNSADQQTVKAGIQRGVVWSDAFWMDSYPNNTIKFVGNYGSSRRNNSLVMDKDGLRMESFYRMKLTQDNMDYYQGTRALCIQSTGYYYSSPTSTFDFYNVIKTDGTAPTITTSKDNQDWTNVNVPITINVVDSRSGVNNWRYRVSNTTTFSGNWTVGTGSSTTVTFSNTGVYYIQVEATDNVGNTITVVKGPYKVDKVLPTVNYSPNNSTWRNNYVSTTISVADVDSTVAMWRYRISSNNGTTWGSWSAYETSALSTGVTMTGTGVWLIQTSVQDKAGNIATVVSGQYLIDAENPSGVFTPNSRGWSIDSVDVVFNPSDTGGSGVKSWRYALSSDEGTTWGSYSSVINGDNSSTISLSAKGHWRIRVEVTDIANNVSTLTSGIYYITTKPIAEFTVSTPVLANQTLSYINTSRATEANTSIIANNWRWSKDNGTWISGQPTSFDLTQYSMTAPSGVYYIQLQVTDAHGIVSDWSASRQVVVYRPNTKPSASFTLSPAVQFVTGTVTYSINNTPNDLWDSISMAEWSYSSNNGSTWSTPTSTPPTSFATEGDYIIRYRVRDIGNVLSGPLWSDYATQTIKIVKPTADFTVAPSTQYTYLPLTYTDNSRTNLAGNNISQREWSYSTDKGVTWSTPTSTPTTVFTERGDYWIRLRVASTNTGVYPKVWSDYLIRRVMVLNNLYLTPTLDINPAKQGQKVTLSVFTRGYAANEIVRYPTEFRLGLVDRAVHVEFMHTEYYSFIVPLDTPVTLDANGNRVRSPYVILVDAVNNDGLSKSEPVYLDVQGNVLDNIFTEIR